MPSAPSDDALRALLQTCGTVAVVGLSPDPERPSHDVSRYLQTHGIRVLPINPTVHEVLGELAWPNLDALPQPPHIVVVFRRPDQVPPIAAAAVRGGAHALWLQPGAVHPAAAETARAAGLLVVEGRCIREEHRRLLTP